MASELERLLLTFEADTRKLRDALSTAESGVEKFENKANRSLRGVESRFAAFEAKAVGSLKSVGAAILAQATADNIYKNITDVAALQKTAVVAGVTAEKLQELRAAARAAGLENTELDGVMTKFAVTMGEFRGRTGDLYEFLRSQLPTIEAQLRATKSQGEAFDVVAETVRRLTSAEDKALFTKKALGESSVLLTTALAGGSKGLREAGEKAKEFSQVVSDDAVKATAELKKEIDDIGASITATFQQRIGDAAPAITSFLQEARKQFNKNDFLPMQFIGRAVARSTVQAPAQEFGQEFGRVSGTAAAETMQSAMSDALKIRQKLPDFSTELDFTAADALNDLARKHAEAVGDSGATIRLEYEKELETFRRMLAEKKISVQEFEMAREQLSIAAGAKIGEAYAKETEVLRARLDDVKSTIDQSIGRGLDDVLRTGKLNFAEMLRDMTVNLAKLAIQAQITKPILDSLFRPGGAGAFMGGDGGFSFGGLLSAAGSTFGGMRAGGGPVSAGKSYVVGERRPEVFTPSTSGYIRPSTGGAGGSTFIDARGADMGVEQRLRSLFAGQQGAGADPVAAVAAARKRFPTRKAA